MCACGASGSSHIVRLLLKRGSNVNYAAVRLICVLLASSSVDYSCSPQPDSGMTALHTACKAGSSKLIHLFLDKGADPMARDVRPACLSLAL